MGIMPGASGLPREFLAAIIDSVAHPIFVKDRDFRFVLLNLALCDMVGYSREEMIGKTDYDFFPKQEADFFRQKDVEMFASGRPTVIDEEPITDASGSTHILATTKVPLRDDAGTVTHLVGIVHDITRLKDAEERLRVANEALESRVNERTTELMAAQHRLLRQERLAVLGQLAGGLAHQIRNPLGSISNAGFVLRRLLRDHEDADVRRAIEIILEETAQANRIVTDLVDFARVRRPERRPVSLAELLRHLLDSMALPESIAVTCELPALPELGIDARQVHDAIRNLLENAVEAMPQGGTLRLSAKLEGAYVVLHVEDSGPGIAPEIAARLFEPLITTKPLGLGLGLATARYLIEHQGGELRSVTPDGPGARFDVRLPVA